MTKRATSLRFAEGTQTVGTAKVREDRGIAGYAQRKRAELHGTKPNSKVDEIMSCAEPVVSLAPPPRATPRQAAKQALQALGRLKTGAMNKTEAAYERHLAGLKHAGEIAWYRFEGVKLRLADSTFYTPDFAVMLAGGEMECHEVKGHWQDDARAKIKIAADQYPFRFIAITAKTKKSGGGWAVEEF